MEARAKRGPKKGYQVMIWVPAIVRELGDLLTDREKLFCNLIYSLHKQTHTAKRDRWDMYHIANNDFQNILGWKSFVTDYNGKLENLRRVCKIAQAGGYWQVQWSDECMEFKPTKNRNICSYDWVYLKDPHAIALHYYLVSRFATTEMLSDYEEGMDMNEFYREPVLRRTEYNILKFSKSLYFNDAS